MDLLIGFPRIMEIVTLILYTILLIGLTYLFVIVLKTLRLYNACKNVPGPKILPIVGNALMFIGDITKISSKLFQLYDIYPSLFRVWIGNNLFICTKDAEIIKVILSSSSAAHKSDLYKCMKPLLGDGLVTAPVSKWQIHRKSLSQVFNKNILVSFVDTFVKHTNIFVQKLELTNEEEIEVYQPINACALDIIYETMMKIQPNFQNDKDGKFGKATKLIGEMITCRMFKWWLYPDIIFWTSSLMKETKMCLNYINNWATEVFVITQKNRKLETSNVQNWTQGNKEEQKPKLFMDILMQLSKNGGKFLDRILCDGINTFVFGGSYTINDTLTFLFLMLAMFPEIQNKVYQELHEIYGTSNVEDMLVECNDFQRMD